MKNDYYIYEWYNTETGEVFYVGKGKNRRMYVKSGRNKHFINYINRYKCDVRKSHKGLSESEAYSIETEQIKQYRSIGQAICNYSDGGKGNNGLVHSDETRERLSKTHIGELNSQYGISPEERMSKEVFDAWRNKIGISAMGEGNGNSRFTEQEVLDIRKLYDKGLKVSEIVEIYYPETKGNYKLRKRKWSTINHIVKRDTWKNI